MSILQRNEREGRRVLGFTEKSSVASLRMAAVQGCRPGGCLSSVRHTRRHTMLAWPTDGDANMAYLVKVMTCSFFIVKVPFLPLLLVIF